MAESQTPSREEMLSDLRERAEMECAKTTSQSPWRQNNVEYIDKSGCDELVAAVWTGEISWYNITYITSQHPDRQREILDHARVMGTPSAERARKSLDAPEDMDSDDDSEEIEESAGCGLSSKSLKELPSYWTDEDCETIESLNLRLLGHPDYDVRVPLPSSLPPSAQAEPSKYVLWLLLWCMQQGRDIAGFHLSWWSGEMDHIYSENRRKTLGNIQLLSPALNGSKGQLPQPEFADNLLRMKIITTEQRDEIVRQHEHRTQDPIGFLRWQLEQARISLADNDSESGKHNDAQHPEGA